MVNISISHLLVKLEELWETKDAPILSRLNAGIDLQQLEFDNFTGHLPEEMIALYGWRNGVRSVQDKELSGKFSLFELGIFISVETLRSIQDEKANVEYGWEPTKLPLFESGRGDYYILDCEEKSESKGMIFYHSLNAVRYSRMVTCYDSLYSLFYGIYNCTEQGIYSYDDSGKLATDRRRSFEIRKELNPRSDYWKLF
jgi:hypothetical protein